MCEELKQLLNNYARTRASEQESLKTGSDGVYIEVMSDGSSFHKSAPTTGNDRLPMVLHAADERCCQAASRSRWGR